MPDNYLREEMLRTFLHEEMKRYDQGTWEHSLRVGKLCKLIALEMDFGKPEVAYITLAGLLHDVGKVFMPDLINFPRSLAVKEKYMVSHHPEIGSKFVKITWEQDLPPEVFDGIGLHHERMDGTGYPYRLSGEEIPDAARIVAAADVFDAMNNFRPYRPPLPMDEILDELTGSGYDNNVVYALLQRIKHQNWHLAPAY
ncbi:MAG: HD domain-containing protein [Clostridia bacterium]|jgi:putative nucleotidyltransferase with HDIG domain|nr:HD domain-containing protein [Clostridia bacterium]